MIKTLYHDNYDNEESKCDEKENIIHDIIDDMCLYNTNETYEEMNNKDIENIFKKSYVDFIDFIKYNILVEKTYDIDENIDKYSKLYINLLYDVIYTKASYQEELLNDFIYDEDGSFFEYYKNYTPSKNITIVSDLNEIHKELEDTVFSLHNLNVLKDYVLKFANLYIILTSENDD